MPFDTILPYAVPETSVYIRATSLGPILNSLPGFCPHVKLVLLSVVPFLVADNIEPFLYLLKEFKWEKAQKDKTARIIFSKIMDEII